MKSPLGQKPKIKIPFGVVIPTAVGVMILNTVFFFNIVNRVIKDVSPQPTQDTSALQAIALTRAWIQITQTFMSLPTSTLAPSNTSTEAPTASAIPTLASTSTQLPTATLIIFIPATQAPVATSLPAQSVCSCAGDTLNCTNFTFESQAQACFNYCMSQGVGDIHGLDGNGDGAACESLP